MQYRKKENKYKSLKIEEYENFRIYQIERIGSKQRSSIFATTISRLPSVLHQFHWNIKGHNFFVLHSQFEKMYDDTAEKVDEIAERILMLGGTPANKFSDYLKVANVNEVDKVSNGDEALNNILQSISYLIGEERKILSIASQAGDEVTVSMMSDYLKEQEKLDIIEHEYNIPTSQEFREDVRIMCNLSTGIEERATERATEKTSEKFILNMYKKGYTLDQIADVAETDVDEVEAIIKKKEPAMA